MRMLVVGLGIQGKKRAKVAGLDVVATVDQRVGEADFESVYDVPLDKFDGVLCCTPDEPKYELVSYFLSHAKHVLVEKPMWVEDSDQILDLERRAVENRVQCYTAYNHRFEPHFESMKTLLSGNRLGEIYRCRLFYGNGTAQLVRDSEWRDKGAGVLPDLASHLLDIILFWFGEPAGSFKVASVSCFENRAPDHVVLSCESSKPKIELEMTLLQWKNDFRCDIFGEKGSAHIESLCKWGPSIFTVRDRVFPVGRPNEETVRLIQEDPTWEKEYKKFLLLCHSGHKVSLSKDLWLSRQINRLSKEAIALL